MIANTVTQEEMGIQLLNSLSPKQHRERRDRQLTLRYLLLKDKLEELEYPGKIHNQIRLIKFYEKLTCGDSLE